MKTTDLKENFTGSQAFHNVTCPFCGLLCDDLSVQRDAGGTLKITEKGCARSASSFGRLVSASPSPRIAGKPVALATAVSEAASILGGAQLPLIAGLGTEVQGMRAIMELADKTGAIIDHMNSNGFMRNLLSVQNSGWQTCTLTEARNRVDLLVVIGTDIVSLFPRFFERVLWNEVSLFETDTAKREVVYLGGRGINTPPGISPDGRQPDILECDLVRLPEVIAVLRSLVSGQRLHADDAGGIPMGELEKLAERLKSARYSVLAWAAGALNFPHAELTVQNVAELVKTLNQTTRSSGLPLGGTDGDMTANQVSAWISGYPVRTSYARGYPEHDPYHFSTDYVLGSDGADALLWISSLDPQRSPPRCGVPLVVLGHPGIQLTEEPEVFIPVGLPGIDHKGVMFRSDNVVSLPLEKLLPSPFPAVSDVIAAIGKALPPC